MLKRIKVTLASAKDDGITIRTRQLGSNLKFVDGDVYFYQPSGLQFGVPLRVSRGGATLYSGKLDAMVREKLTAMRLIPALGKPITTLASISKQLKSVRE